MSTPEYHSSLHVNESAHLDQTSYGQRRDSQRDGDRLVPILALDQVVAAELFLGFRERPIRDHRLAVFLANRDGAGGPVQLLAGQQATAVLEFMDEFSLIFHDLRPLRIRKFCPLDLVSTPHQQVLHNLSPRMGRSQPHR